MKKLTSLFKLVVTILAIYFLVKLNIISFNDISKLRENYLGVFIIIFLMFVTLVIASYKWWILLKKIKYDIPYLMSYYLYTTGLFFNIFMPGSAGGDLIKGLYLFKFVKTSQRTNALSTIIVDRLIGLHALLLITFSSLILLWDKIFLVTEIKYMFFLITFLILFIPLIIYFLIRFSDEIIKLTLSFDGRIQKKINEVVHKLLLSTKLYKNKISTLLYCYFLSTLNHLIQIFCFFIMSLILFLDSTDMLYIFLASSLSLVINITPITPGGIGVGEGAFDFIVSSFYENKNNIAYGSIFFITYRVLFTLVSIVGAYSFIIIKKPNNLYERI